MTSNAAEVLDRALDDDRDIVRGPSSLRRGRVWKAPRPRGATAAIVATAGLIGLGGVALGQATRMPAPAVDAADLEPGSLYHLVDQVGARGLWAQGVTGDGVTVAVIDTGTAPVRGLRDQVVATVDLSSEHDDAVAAFTDNHGHGTHIAGIIAGRDPGGPLAGSVDEPGRFLGVAPGADLVSIKVAGRDGSVEPEAVLGAIEWAIDHRDELGIRVLNLAINVEATGPYVDDPLAGAVERAWNAGIVVVTAAGNTGIDADGLGSPAHDPFVITVGAVKAEADGFSVPDWTSAGDGVRNPDVAAPGAHIRSLRVPGSYADVDHPEGYVDERLFLASGTSQSAAVVSGIAALVLDARPELDPDDVKAALVASAVEVPGGAPEVVGAGLVRADLAVRLAGDAAPQDWTPSRATAPFTVPAGASFVLPDWAGNTWAGNTWAGNTWAGNTWA
ncbi:MAG: S8 family serine peptidase [Acidimicrobiia bacterium]